MKLLHRKSSFWNYGFTLLIAVECLMSFTFLGYIHVPPISITIACLPILLAGCFLSIPETTIIGVIFGLASMFKASSYYVSGMDSAFSPFSSDFPFGSLLLSVGARALFAFLIGVFLVRARKSRHPAGDTALQTVSEYLDELFADYGKVGRMGGDEFAVIIEQELSPVAMKELLDHLIEILNANTGIPGKLSCSIGACCFTYPEDVQTLYEETDQLLYNAKEKGRNCYVMAAYENGKLTIM